MTSGSRFVPAAGRRAFTRLYDPVVALTMRERRFRSKLLAEVERDLPTGATVADIGCGTGTFAIALAAARPDATVLGFDGDPDVLAIARQKPSAKAVQWRPGLAGALPLADGSVDAAVMSLVLHHLPRDGKAAALADARRAISPGGRLHIADWGRPGDPLMRGAFFVLQLVDGFDGTRDHAQGRLPEFISTAGFRDVACHDRLRTAWGSLELLSARR
jgi:ubiquinone/menaquinone biosynthesis C-methylase UbiE